MSCKLVPYYTTQGPCYTRGGHFSDEDLNIGVGAECKQKLHILDCPSRSGLPSAGASAAPAPVSPGTCCDKKTGECEPCKNGGNGKVSDISLIVMSLVLAVLLLIVYVFVKNRKVL